MKIVPQIDEENKKLIKIKKTEMENDIKYFVV